MDQFTSVADHDLIGHLQTAALVTTDCAIDFYRRPRFDSPSIFAALLDRAHGDYLRIAADDSECVTKQLYFPDVAILITRFMTADGVDEVIDFTSNDYPTMATAHHKVVLAERRLNVAIALGRDENGKLSKPHEELSRDTSWAESSQGHHQ